MDEGPEGPDRRRPRPASIRSLVGLVGAYAVPVGVLLVLLAFPLRNRAKVREKGAGNGTGERDGVGQLVRGMSQPSKGKSVQSEAGEHQRRR